MTKQAFITHAGTTQPITEWALDYGIPAALIVERLNAGWSVASAIETEMLTSSKRMTRRVAHGERIQKNAVLLTLGDATHTLATWSRRTGLSVPAIRQRLHLGWSIERALTEPAHPVNRPITFNGKTRTTVEWAQHLGMEPGTLYARLRRMALEEALTKPKRRSPRPKQTPGVGPNFAQSNGTGGGSSPRECAEIENFNQKENQQCP